MRLTEKNDVKKIMKGFDYLPIDEYEGREQEWTKLTLNKLGQLEDIEEELGIDLITLFKALKQGYIYYPIDCPNDCYKYKIECLYMKPRIHLYIADGVGGCYMEDYGKTWVLTKEELEKGD